MKTKETFHKVIETKEDLEYLASLAKEKTTDEIANILGISRSKTYTVLRWNNLKAQTPVRPKKEKLPKVPKKDHELIQWVSYTNHGKLRNVYYNMLKRCYKEDNKGYKDYGARGIKVCEEWRNDCCVFYKWAQETGYNETLQLDRIDNNGNYCPENCRWVTPQENSYNKRNTRKITYKGKVKTLLEWEKETGIPRVILADRIFKYKWNIEKSLTTPVKQ